MTPLRPNQAFVYYDPHLLAYDAEPPFSPHEACPEYRMGHTCCAQPNRVYQAVRQCLLGMGMDAAHYGTSAWNPLGEIIEPGCNVVIKPNLVLDVHARGGALESVITHGAVIRAMLDYVLLALRGEGRVVVGDAPLQKADFGRLCRVSGLDRMVKFVQERTRVAVELADFRQERALVDDQRWIRARLPAAGDSAGYAVVNLAEESRLAPIARHFRRYRVTNYDPELMPLHHNLRANEYLVAQSVLSADVVISLPKIKTHRKAGITACLKNSVGINGHKDWLPHHRRGAVSQGGDEYLHPSALKSAADSLTERADVAGSGWTNEFLRHARRLPLRLARCSAADGYLEGSWYGNDTLWRTIVDLNRILLYADQRGKMREQAQRRCLFLADGIIAGEGEGPLEPTAKPCGLLAGGRSAAAVDAVIARLMGFDFQKIPSVREAFAGDRYPLADFGPEQIEVLCNAPRFSALNLFQPGDSLAFVPPAGWKGHIELPQEENRATAAQ